MHWRGKKQAVTGSAASGGSPLPRPVSLASSKYGSSLDKCGQAPLRGSGEGSEGGSHSADSSTTGDPSSARQEEETDRNLREDQADFYAVAEQLSEGVLLYDRTGTLLFCNSAALKIHALPDAPEGKRQLQNSSEFFQLLTYAGSIIADEQWPLRRVLREEVVSGLELVVRKKDTSWKKIFSFEGKMISSAGGKALVCLTINDLTSWKQAEESHHRLAAIISSSNDAIVGKTLDGIITSWNPAAEKVFGYSSEEAIGQPMLMVFPTERIGEEADILGRIKRGQVVDHFETERVHKNGHRINVSVALSPICDPSGKIVGISKIARDITLRKQHESEIERLSCLYTALSLINQAIVHAGSRDELFQKICRSLVEQGGIQMAWIGWHNPEDQSLVPVSQWGDSDGYLQSIKLSSSGKPEGQGPGGIAFREKRSYLCHDICLDPATLPWRSAMLQSGFRSLAVLPIRLQGEVCGILSVYAAQAGFFHGREAALLNEAAQDISFALDNFAREEKQRQAEDEIRRLNATLEQSVLKRTAQLEEANKELEAFSYSVSHDLRAPLRAISGFSGIILTDFGNELPDEVISYLKRIQAGGQRMGALIDDLLAFSRLGRQSLKTAEVDNRKLVFSVIDDLKVQTEGRRIEFRVGALPSCRGDISLLRQVWFNLLSNAVKYTRGRLPALCEIGCIEEETKLIHFVKDNGVGFDMKYASKLFGVFQRMHRADEFEGTGVGLAIVQRIVQRHGGRIWVEAQSGCGATFYFTLEGARTP